MANSVFETNEKSIWIAFAFLEPPSFIKAPKTVEGLRGKDISINCELSGTPPFEITWYKDNKALKESRKYKFVQEGGSATLHILNLDATDPGEYQCKALNQVGSDTCSSTVKLRGKYNSSHGLKYITINIDGFDFKMPLFITIFFISCRATRLCEETV